MGCHGLSVNDRTLSTKPINTKTNIAKEPEILENKIAVSLNLGITKTFIVLGINKKETKQIGRTGILITDIDDRKKRIGIIKKQSR
jgi:hypothetical protein